MANERNLRPQAHKITVDEASKGGKASAKARREKKTIKALLGDILEESAKDNKAFSSLAQKLGLQGDESVKKVFSLVCLINGAKKGNLDELIKLSRLLGEDFLDDGERSEAEEFDLASITPFERVNSAEEFGEISEEVEGDEGP